MVISYGHAQLLHEDFEIVDSVTYDPIPPGTTWDTLSRLHVSGLWCDSASIQNPGDIMKMTTNSFDASFVSSVYLYFNHIAKIEFFDLAYLELSLDGGATWIALNDDIAGSLQNCTYLGYGLFSTQSSKFQEASYSTWQPGITILPDSSWWKREIFDISALAAYQPDVRLRFVLADGNNNGGFGRSGWYIDDLLVADTLNFNYLPLSNRVMGMAYFDYNANLVMDGTDMPVVNHPMRGGIFPFNIHKTDSTGNYSMYMQETGTVYISPWNWGQQSNYYNVVPPLDSALFSGWQQTDSLHDFAFQPTGVFDDLLLLMPYSSRIRSGMSGIISLVVNNQGTTPQNATLVMYPDTGLTYQSTIGLQPSSVTTDSIVWNVNNIQPLSQELIMVQLMANSGDTMGTIFSSSAILYPVTGDYTPSDNYDTTLTELMNSWDPNDITVYPEIIYTPDLVNDPVLEYTIRFQNTGNDTAFFVRVEQSIPPELDINTFELISSSHDVQLFYNGMMRYTFDNILLPDSVTNPEGSQGFVTFRIRPVSGLVAGDSIQSHANIYFDNNPPITTNTATTVIVDPLSVPENGLGICNMKLYPNPATGNITVALPKLTGENAQVEIFNVLGSVVYSGTQMNEAIKSQLLQLDISEFPAGVYTVVYTDDTNMSAARFVKMNW